MLICEIRVARQVNPDDSPTIQNPTPTRSLFRLFPLGFWPMSMVSVVADDHWLYEEVSKRGRGCGANHGTEQQVFPKTQDAHPTLKMTAGPGCLSHRRPMMGMAQKKIADAVLQ